MDAAFLKHPTALFGWNAAASRSAKVFCSVMLLLSSWSVGEVFAQDDLAIDTNAIKIDSSELEFGEVLAINDKARLDLRDRAQINRRRPVIVAHRGGVVTDLSPECSMAAIRLAADQGYDMVELDIQMSRDGVPVVFHDATLDDACGRAGRIADYAAGELEVMEYVGSEERIARLETALQECRRRNLGVMLDFKTGRDSVEFVQKVNQLLVNQDLSRATVTISDGAAVRNELVAATQTPTPEEMMRLRRGESIDLRHRFWFGLPSRLQPGDLDKLKKAGALVIPAINTFRYPEDQHLELARQDINRLLRAGVDGFQIDSVYLPLVRAANSK